MKTLISKLLVLRYIKTNNIKFFNAVLHYSSNFTFKDYTTDISKRDLMRITKAFREDPLIEFTIDKKNIRINLILKLLELETVKQSYIVKNQEDKGIYCSLKCIMATFECSKPFALKLKKELKDSNIVTIKSTFYVKSGKTLKGSDKIYRLPKTTYKINKKDSSPRTVIEKQYSYKYSDTITYTITSVTDRSILLLEHKDGITKPITYLKDEPIARYILSRRKEWLSLN